MGVFVFAFVLPGLGFEESCFAVEGSSLALGGEGSLFDPVKGQFDACAGEDFLGERGNVQIYGDEGDIEVAQGIPDAQALGRQFDAVGDFNVPLSDSGRLDVKAGDAV